MTGRLQLNVLCLWILAWAFVSCGSAFVVHNQAGRSPSKYKGMNNYARHIVSFSIFSKKAKKVKSQSSRRNRAFNKSNGADNSLREVKGAEQLAMPEVITSKKATPIDNDIETDADAIFRKYGIGQGGFSSEQSKPKKVTKATDGKNSQPAFGESVLEKVPMSLQKKIDRILITGTFLALTFCVLCGIGESLPQESVNTCDKLDR